MVLANKGIPSGWLILATVFGGTLAAGGANATNMVIDRDIDALMKRTQNRPLVTGEIKPRPALIFAMSLQIVAFVQLWVMVNLASASLAVGAGLFYIFVYSLWLKRTSSSNIVIGGAAGAVPVLVGWTAVTNSINWTAIVLFILMFLWTPPHFWALAIKYEDDYAAADVPMLPTIATRQETARRIFAYAIAVWIMSAVLIPVGGMGYFYSAVAFISGGLFVLYSFRLLKDPEPRKAMKVFAFSITFVTALFAALAVDEIIRSGW